MKPSEQRLNEARRQHTEAIVTRHVYELFQRLQCCAVPKRKLDTANDGYLVFFGNALVITMYSLTARSKGHEKACILN